MRRFGSATAPGGVPAPLARRVLAGASPPAPTATNGRRDAQPPAPGARRREQLAAQPKWPHRRYVPQQGQPPRSPRLPWLLPPLVREQGAATAQPKAAVASGLSCERPARGKGRKQTKT